MSVHNTTSGSAIVLLASAAMSSTGHAAIVSYELNTTLSSGINYGINMETGTVHLGELTGDDVYLLAGSSSFYVLHQTVGPASLLARYSGSSSPSNLAQGFTVGLPMWRHVGHRVGGELRRGFHRSILPERDQLCRGALRELRRCLPLWLPFAPTGSDDTAMHGEGHRIRGLRRRDHDRARTRGARAARSGRWHAPTPLTRTARSSLFDVEPSLGLRKPEEGNLHRPAPLERGEDAGVDRACRAGRHL